MQDFKQLLQKIKIKKGREAVIMLTHLQALKHREVYEILNQFELDQFFPRQELVAI